jgi:hypothetical protein
MDDLSDLIEVEDDDTLETPPPTKHKHRLTWEDEKVGCFYEPLQILQWPLIVEICPPAASDQKERARSSSQ